MRSLGNKIPSKIVAQSVLVLILPWLGSHLAKTENDPKTELSYIPKSIYADDMVQSLTGII